ncbi:MAG: hypothetical protein D6795_19020 [Deltaproteobacteria bacterium]|nr:MAG: hypothetical protein D6795_19020 [Deltaproteobacteria bacterium]
MQEASIASRGSVHPTPFNDPFTIGRPLVARAAAHPTGIFLPLLWVARKERSEGRRWGDETDETILSHHRIKEPRGISPTATERILVTIDFCATFSTKTILSGHPSS